MGCTLDEDIVVIDDNYTGQVKQNYQLAGEILDEVLEGYTGILQKLVDEDGISGKTAEKVAMFAGAAESLLKGMGVEWSGQLAGQMEEYVEEIDKANVEIY